VSVAPSYPACIGIYRITLSPVACLSLPYFSTLPQKQHDCQKNIDHKIRLLICSTHLSEAFLTIRRIQRDNAIKVHGSSYKVPVIPFTF
jgi:hypothetical protein